MPFLRFIILQVILCAGIFTLMQMGYWQPAFQGQSAYFVSGVLAVALVGILLAGLGRLADAAKLQDLLPVIAVCAMQVGILSALAATAQALMSSGDPSKAVGGFFGALSTALYVSVSALASYLWLRITLWLAYGE